MLIGMKKYSFLCFILGLASLFCGCTSSSSDEASLPWARPAEWEGTPPGMSNLPGAGAGRR